MSEQPTKITVPTSEDAYGAVSLKCACYSAMHEIGNAITWASTLEIPLEPLQAAYRALEDTRDLIDFSMSDDDDPNPARAGSGGE